MAREKSNKKPPAEKKVTRYTFDDVKEQRTPETGHTSLLPADEQVITLPMDNGWTKAVTVGKLPDHGDRPVVLDMDPAADPVMFWAGKRNRREVPVLPLQRNEVVSESRISQLIDRARQAAAVKAGLTNQGRLFAELERTLRETDKKRRVEFYAHDEGWKNKLICGDSLQVMESLPGRLQGLSHHDYLDRYRCQRIRWREVLRRANQSEGRREVHRHDHKSGRSRPGHHLRWRNNAVLC